MEVWEENTLMIQKFYKRVTILTLIVHLNNFNMKLKNQITKAF